MSGCDWASAAFSLLFSAGVLRHGRYRQLSFCLSWSNAPTRSIYHSPWCLAALSWDQAHNRSRVSLDNHHGATRKSLLHMSVWFYTRPYRYFIFRTAPQGSLLSKHWPGEVACQVLGPPSSSSLVLCQDSCGDTDVFIAISGFLLQICPTLCGVVSSPPSCQRDELDPWRIRSIL